MSDKTLGAYERHESPDYFDGGVTGALIEEEAEKHPRLSAMAASADEAERRWPRDSATSPLDRTRRADRRIGFMVGAKWGRGSVYACPDLDVHWRYDEAQETIQRLRKERDEARATKDMHKRRADEERARADAAESRPLTPDAITADAYERGVPVLRAAPQKPSVMVAHETVRAIVAAVLTEPPARPEGAEELAPVVDEMLAAYWAGDLNGPDAADFLAERGVRVVGEERS